MNIRLKWTNKNIGEDGTYVYRSTSPMLDTANLPAPIATLGSGVTEYIDTDVIRGQVYYYRLGAFKGTQIAVSNQIMATAVRRTGPGPQALKYGDEEWGYYGTLTASDLFTASALSSTLGYSEGTVAYDTTDWLKFAFKGKVLFIPKQPLRHTVSWNGLYAKGLVYGTNDNGLYPAATPVSQQTYVTKNGEVFLVRLMSGDATDPTIVTSISSQSMAVNTGSEWDTLAKVCAEILPYQIGGNWDEISLADLTLNSTSTTGGRWTILKETASTTTMCLLRGSGSFDTAATVSKTTAGSSIGWRPVLEYVPS